MKITKRQLLQLLRETYYQTLNESAYEEMVDKISKGKSELSSGLLRADSTYPDAIIVHFKGKAYGVGDKIDKDEPGTANNMVQRFMNAVSKKLKNDDLKNRNYYVWRGLDDLWASGMTELDEVGTQKNDKIFLYQKADKGKFRVIAGPNPKTIGKIFSPKSGDDKTPDEDFDFGVLMASSLSSSGSGSSGSSTKSSGSSTKSSGSSF